MLYLYGMRLRGFSPGAQPKDGFSHVLDEFSSLRFLMNNGRPYWNVLAYNRKLNDKETHNYDLDYLGEEFDY